MSFWGNTEEDIKLHNLAFQVEILTKKVSRVEKYTAFVEQKENKMKINVDKLVADVATMKGAVASTGVAMDGAIKALSDASTSISDLKKQLADAVASNDPAAMQAVQDKLDAVDADVTANTDALSSKRDAIAAAVPQNPA